MAANWEDESALMEHHKSKEELEEELTSSSKSTMHYGVSKRQEERWKRSLGAPLKERRARRGADFEQELGRN